MKNGMDLTKLKKSKSDFCVITPAHQFPTGVINEYAKTC